MGKMRSHDNLSNVADKKKIELTLFGRVYYRVIMGRYWVIGLLGHWVIMGSLGEGGKWKRTRSDTWLFRSRVGGQGSYLRST